MLCSSTLEFKHDFEVLLNGLSKEESVQKLNLSLAKAPFEKSLLNKMPQQEKPREPEVNPKTSRRVSFMDEIDREDSKPPLEKKKEKRLDS